MGFQWGHGVLWGTMGVSGVPWGAMGCYGTLWGAMRPYGALWGGPWGISTLIIPHQRPPKGPRVAQ